MGLMGGTSLYVYALDNPVEFVDPSGRSPRASNSMPMPYGVTPQMIANAPAIYKANQARNRYMYLRYLMISCYLSDFRTRFSKNQVLPDPLRNELSLFAVFSDPSSLVKDRIRHEALLRTEATAQMQYNLERAVAMAARRRVYWRIVALGAKGMSNLFMGGTVFFTSMDIGDAIYSAVGTARFANCNCKASSRLR